MWPFCLANNPLWLLLPFLLGLATGFWAYYRPRPATSRWDEPAESNWADAGWAGSVPAEPAAEGPEAEVAPAPEPEPAPPPVAATSALLSEAGPGIASSRRRRQPPRPGFTEIGIPAAVGAPDNLQRIKGIGPTLGSLLGRIGVTRFDQIAAWGDAEIALVNAHLGAFRGRITRDGWVEQAGLLARGDVESFEARFGKPDARR